MKFPADSTSTKSRILIANSDQNEAASLCQLLESGGLTATVLEDLEAVTRVLDEDSSYFVILDDQLIEGKQAAYFKKMREIPAYEKAFFMLICKEGTSSDSVADYLDAGADDCYIKPIGNREFVSRVRKVARIEALYFEHEHLAESEALLQSKLNETSGILKAAMDGTQVGIVVAEAPDGEVRYFNAAGLKILGEDPDFKYEGTRISKYIEKWNVSNFDGTPLDKKELPLFRALNHGESTAKEFLFRRPDSRDIYIRASASPVFDMCGNITAGVVVFLDITEQRETLVRLETSQRRSRYAHQFSGVGIWEWNPTTDEFYWSDEIYALFNLNPEEITLTTELILSYIHPDDREVYIREVGACVEKGQDFHLDFRLLLPDGTVRWLADYGNFIRDENGNILLMVGAALDISVRKRHEQQLARLTYILRSIVDVNRLITHERDPGIIMDRTVEILTRSSDFEWALIDLIDAEGKILNRSLANNCKTEIANSVMQSCLGGETELPPGTIFEEPDPSARKTFRTATNDKSDIVRRCGKLSYRDSVYGRLCIGCRAGLSLFEEEQDLFDEICDNLGYALHNIELERQKEESYGDLVLARNQAVAANRAKDEFLAVMNHELRTPLNPIMGYTQLLLQQTEGETRDMLSSVMDSSQRMLALVDMILEYSGLESGRVNPRNEPFNLFDSCKAVFNEVKPDMDRFDYVFENGGGGLQPIDQDLTVYGDRDMFMRVLENLLQNACKYTREGSVTFSFGINHDSAKPDMYRFTVTDTGIGIDQQLIDSLFEAFAQADGSYSRSYGGLGLGLAICRKLVEMLGGSISVISELGKGSTFAVDLPMKAFCDEDVGASDQSSSKIGIPRFKTPIKVLIVEDEVDNANLANVLINNMGGQPVIVCNGKKAIEACKNQAFDVILMDLRMPEMDGFETFEKLRSLNGPNTGTPVVAITANVSDQTKKRCLDAGMAEFLKKPFLLNSLYEVVQSVTN